MTLGTILNAGDTKVGGFHGPMYSHRRKSVVSYYNKRGECQGWVGLEHLVSLPWWGRGINNRKSDLNLSCLIDLGVSLCNHHLFTCLLCSAHHPPKALLVSLATIWWHTQATSSSARVFAVSRWAWLQCLICSITATQAWESLLRGDFYIWKFMLHEI